MADLDQAVRERDNPELTRLRDLQETTVADLAQVCRERDALQGEVNQVRSEFHDLQSDFDASKQTVTAMGRRIQAIESESRLLTQDLIRMSHERDVLQQELSLTSITTLVRARPGAIEEVLDPAYILSLIHPTLAVKRRIFSPSSEHDEAMDQEGNRAAFGAATEGEIDDDGGGNQEEEAEHAHTLVSADYHPWLVDRLNDVAMVSMLIDALFPILPTAPGCLFPYFGPAQGRKPKIQLSDYCWELNTEENVRALLDTHPWEILENPGDAISFEVTVGGRLGILIQEYGIFEDTNLMSYWESTHHFPIPDTMAKKYPWLLGTQ
ncbi:hypothetical protein PHYSODRAFT_255731 [Phytophthora sojae]|uniref:Uncharacterized protein n=1 Tax=Phytophthora sojae (strain P6497) TaxID=1094619 RepID=G4ZFJ2_PHYSP|nr:hypothetical protein PHYSODRAFT_255731 [Phytophthora sojae]EGZ17929.1 hypothetical protein PHYSODRAFT_255731 [Phytophthora sojae]|eukprot:XP_009526987.1 hypothetical protein PHYSODRAFT_255731 [Phytophthora sojae]